MKKVLTYVFIDWLFKPIFDLGDYLFRKDIPLSGELKRCSECGCFPGRRHATRDDLDNLLMQAEAVEIPEPRDVLRQSQAYGVDTKI